MSARKYIWLERLLLSGPYVPCNGRFPAVWAYARSDMDIVDNWRYIGMARTESDIHELMEVSHPPFDAVVYDFLIKKLPQLSRRKLVDLSKYLKPATSMRSPGRLKTIVRELALCATD